MNKKNWLADNDSYGRLIDPRTGEEFEDYITWKIYPSVRRLVNDIWITLFIFLTNNLEVLFNFKLNMSNYYIILFYNIIFNKFIIIIIIFYDILLIKINLLNFRKNTIKEIYFMLYTNFFYFFWIIYIKKLLKKN